MIGRHLSSLGQAVAGQEWRTQLGLILGVNRSQLRTWPKQDRITAAQVALYYLARHAASIATSDAYTFLLLPDGSVQLWDQGDEVGAIADDGALLGLVFTVDGFPAGTSAVQALYGCNRVLAGSLSPRGELTATYLPDGTLLPWRGDLLRKAPGCPVRITNVPAGTFVLDSLFAAANSIDIANNGDIFLDASRIAGAENGPAIPFLSVGYRVLASAWPRHGRPARGIVDVGSGRTKQVLDLLADGRNYRSSEIARSLGVGPCYVSTLLRRLAAAGEIEQLSRGLYRRPTDKQ